MLVVKDVKNCSVLYSVSVSDRRMNTDKRGLWVCLFSRAAGSRYVSCFLLLSVNGGAAIEPLFINASASPAS